MWELDHKEGLTLKNWHFQTVVLEKTFQSPLDSREIKAVNSKESQPWTFIGRTDAEAEAPILWPPVQKTHWKSRLTGKDPELGKTEGRRREQQEDEMVGWYHGFNGHEFEQSQGDSDGQGGLVCCSSWGHKTQTSLSDWTTTATPHEFKDFTKVLF